MATESTMVFYTMGVDYPSLFAQLKCFYPTDTPVAIVSNARHMLFVGKFLNVGQARKDFLLPCAPAADLRK